MGISLFGKSCWTNAAIPAPNPEPSRWELIAKVQYANGYVLKVRYEDCTNFEGIKIMVYRGQCRKLPQYLDPHFQEDKKESPIARFRPDADGWFMAIDLAKSL